MKTLLTALAAVSLLAAPLASAAQAADTAALAAPNATPQSKNWKVGDRVPGTFTASSRYKADVDGLGLPKAPANQRWIHVGDNAYLIDGQTDKVLKIAGVPAKS